MTYYGRRQVGTAIKLYLMEEAYPVSELVRKLVRGHTIRSWFA